MAKLRCILLTTFENNKYVFYINVREYRRDNKKCIIQRHWPHGVHKTKKNKTKTQHNMCWTSNKHKQCKQDMRIPTITDKVVLGTPYKGWESNHILSGDRHISDYILGRS